MQQRPANVTLYVYPASASPLALVVRRGPSKWWHFLLWNRDTGVMTPGSWFNGMLYPHRCDLSPRGETMVMLAYSGRREPITWTALCAPPFAAAQVFWSHHGVRLGGGFFDGRLRCVWVNLVAGKNTAEVRSAVPMEIGYLEEEQPIVGTARERLDRDGWREFKAPPEASAARCWRKPSPRRDHEIVLVYPSSAEAGEPDSSPIFSSDVTYSLRPVGSKGLGTLIEDCSWANWNSHGELCLAVGGRLVMLAPGDPLERARLVLDLNDIKPRPKPGFAAETRHGAGA